MNRKFFVFLFLVLIPLSAMFITPARAGTTINVNSTLDVIADDGYCTLREAIIAVNTGVASGSTLDECPGGSENDTINVPAGVYTLTITGTGEENARTGDLDILKGMTIIGAGSSCGNPLDSNCTIISANGIDRVFDIGVIQAPVELSQMVIEGGQDNGGFCGGGIRNEGNLIMTDVVITGNSSLTCGGGLDNESNASLNNVSFTNNSALAGGAIHNSGDLTITASSFAYDTASHQGGGFFNFATARISDVTFSHETSANSGGGIYNDGFLTVMRTTLNNNQVTSGNGGGLANDGGKVWITNTTVSMNTATKGGGIYTLSNRETSLLNVTLIANEASAGESIYRDTAVGWQGEVLLKNTIVANCPSCGNCGGTALTSLGYNLDTGNTCLLSATGDMTNTDPLLGPLKNNGGKTQTHALLPGSPAINSGTNSGCPAIDQRGFPRLGICDRGAYEYSFLLFMPLILK